ncbi:MAG: fumarylacetoacetate hydrolase family protein [Clostridiales bacterium]|nr:fumarylacetoacetate hydrolase family protein [Clostridiales bacterium]
MKIARVKLKSEIFYGVVEGERIRRIKGDIFNTYQITVESFLISVPELLPPVDPPNIIALGLNYKKHVLEHGSRKVPEKPAIFLKATTSLIGPDQNIILPKMAPSEVDYEAELAVVIGKKARNVEPHEVFDYVLGYTCANDVSARDCQHRYDVQWARGKSFDTFCPLGPWIETEVDPGTRPIKTRINGNIVQDSNTSDMIFSVEYLVSYCSKNMTLLRGTVILTGTPEGVGFARDPQLFLRDGDIVEIEIEGIGILKNGVRKEQ